jgi:AcrR family transcriptional regulator
VTRQPAGTQPAGTQPAGTQPAGAAPAGAGASPAAGTPEVKPSPVAPHIVDAARHVLARDGLAAATLERISAAAGVSRMTLHRRGVTKQDILRAVAERFESEHRAAMWQALVAKGTARERLRRALELQCELTERNLATLEALSAPVRDAIFHDTGPAALTRDVFVEPLQRLLLDGAADGSLAQVDAEETATVLFNMVAHTYRHLRSGHGWSPARAREGVLGLVMDGLVAR